MDGPLVEQIKHCINRVTPFNSSVQAVLRKMNEKPIDVPAICRLLELDPLLTTTILRLANSPFYGFVRTIDSVQDATVLLGIHSLRQIIISYSLIKTFDRSSQGGLDRDGLWRHSISVAVAAKILARETEQNGDTAFVAGMLHDIGQFLMDQCLQDQYASVIRLSTETPCLLSAAETEVLGMSHSQVGAMAIRHWKLPEYLAQVAQRHESPPDNDEAVALIDVVHLANIIIKGLQIVPEHDSLMVSVSERSLQRLSLDWPHIEKLLPEIEDMCQEVMERLL